MNHSHSRRQTPGIAALTFILAFTLTHFSIGMAAPRQQRFSTETTCEVVSIGQWYCTIDGKGYYCDTNKNTNKNCRTANTTAPMQPLQPESPWNLRWRANFG